MSDRYDVTIYYFECPHPNQVYDGFARLQKQGVVDLRVVPTSGSYYKGVLHTEINGKHVIYDTLDGLIWLDKPLAENMDYFVENIDCDYYFKRSYTPKLLPYVNNRFVYRSLGLNYGLDYIGNYPRPLIRKIKNWIIERKFVERFSYKKIFRLEDLECEPYPSKEHHILFLARLWNPDDVSWNREWYEERPKMNEMRMGIVRELRKMFGDRFVGGIQRDAYSEKVCPDLMVPEQMTRRDNFLKEVRKSDICIATTGLFDSIGWKFAEYMAASRAIISEPLRYELPGDCVAGKNYLSFTTVEQCIEAVERLISNDDMLKTMMHSNREYYMNYVRSDKMILNTLNQIA